MDPGPIFYILFTSSCYNTLLLFHCNYYCFPHCAANPLFLQDRRDWQPLCFELGKVLVCFCADSTLLKAPPSPALFWRHPSPTGSITLGRNSRETCCCLHDNLPLGVHQLVAIKQFSGAVAGNLEATGKGSLSVSISLLCFCSCFSFVLLAVKNQKPKFFYSCT